MRSTASGRNARGSAPIVMTILLVAVVVILGATVAVFALSISSDAADPAPNVALETTLNDKGNITVVHLSGESLSPDRLTAVNGQIVQSSLPGDEIRAGNTFQVAPAGDLIRIIWQGKQDSFVLTSTTGQFTPLGGSSLVEFVDGDGTPLFEGDEFDYELVLRYVNSSNKNEVRFRVFDPDLPNNNTYVTTNQVKPGPQSEFSFVPATANCNVPYGGEVVDISDNPPNSVYDLEIEIDLNC